MIKIRVKVFCIVLLMLGVTNLTGQSQDRATLVLDLKKAKVAYETARVKLENDTRLLDAKAISQIEYSKSKNDLLGAEVEYQKLMLKLVSQQSYIVVEKAIKYQTPKGDKRVKVTIRSSMDGNQDYLSQFKEHSDLFTPEIRTGKTYNIYVSLNDLGDNTIIGTPYEIRIPSIELGDSYDVDFGLLRDVETLQVILNYNNRREEKNILLEKDASASYIDVTSTHFSQEADLGSNASFDLSLERFSSSEDVFRLMVVNLPKQVSYSFEDAETGARLSNIKFNQGINLRKLVLKAFLPERGDENIVIDRPIIFYALAVTESQAEGFEKDQYDSFSDKDFQDIQGGKIRLELIPRGIGKLEVRANNLYHELTPGEQIEMEVTLKNFGTRRVDNITVKTDNPLNWVSTIEPSFIRSLDPEQEVKLNIVISPPNNVGVGAQEVKIKTVAYADNRMIETVDRVVRIQVNSKQHIGGTILLVILLIAIIAGVVVFGVKISKR